MTTHNVSSTDEKAGRDVHGDPIDDTRKGMGLFHTSIDVVSSFSPSLYVRKGSATGSIPYDSQATTDVSTSTTTNIDVDAATLDSHSFGSSASLKRMTSLASQASNHVATANGTSNNSGGVSLYDHPPTLDAPQAQAHAPSPSHRQSVLLENGSFLIPPGVVLYRMTPPISLNTDAPSATTLPPPPKFVQPLSSYPAVSNHSQSQIPPVKEVKSGLTSRLESAAAVDSAPPHEVDFLDQTNEHPYFDDPFDAPSHGQPQPLLLNDYTPPTSLNVTPTKLFSRSGDTAEMEATDQLLLSPPAEVRGSLAMGHTSDDPEPMSGGDKRTSDEVNARGTGIVTSPDEALSSFVVGSTASSSTGSTTIQSQQQPPVLYSAIGSLEHPSNSFTKGLKSRAFAKTHKFDFPSSTLLAPPMHIVAKRRNVLESSGGISSSTSVVRERSGLVDGKLQSGTRAKQPTRQALTSATATAADIQQRRMGVLKRSTDGSSSGSSGKLQYEDDESKKSGTTKKVTISSSDLLQQQQQPKHMKSRRQSTRSRTSKNPVIEMFRPSSDAYTPRMGKKEIKFKPAEQRTPVQQMASPLGTLSRPNFRDALRRVAMILHQHIVKIERRFERKADSLSPRREEDDGLFSETMKMAFSEDRYVTPRYKCTMVRVPMARSGMVCGLKPIREHYEIPSEGEIYEFAHQLFKTVQLSSECSIVCLIYVERLMEAAKVPVLASTWRPIFMCGLLLASKVWQDLSSWNIEFASVYPRYSLESINRLELHFLRMVKWDLYISSSQYAKYYFALRSLLEKPDFRQRYNRMVGGVDSVHASHARKIEERSTMVKEEALLHLSRSM